MRTHPWVGGEWGNRPTYRDWNGRGRSQGVPRIRTSGPTSRVKERRRTNKSQDNERMRFGKFPKDRVNGILLFVGVLVYRKTKREQVTRSWFYWKKTKSLDGLDGVESRKLEGRGKPDLTYREWSTGCPRRRIQ